MLTSNTEHDDNQPDRSDTNLMISEWERSETFVPPWHLDKNLSKKTSEIHAIKNHADERDRMWQYYWADHLTGIKRDILYLVWKWMGNCSAIQRQSLPSTYNYIVLHITITVNRTFPGTIRHMKTQWDFPAFKEMVEFLFSMSTGAKLDTFIQSGPIKLKFP